MEQRTEVILFYGVKNVTSDDTHNAHFPNVLRKICTFCKFRNK